MINKANFLASVPFFSLMKKMELERMAKQAQEHFFHDGDIIFNEGDNDRRLFIVVSGLVEVIKNLGTKKEKRLGTFGPSSYFGEMALIDDSPRSASAIAGEDETELIVLDKSKFTYMVQQLPDFSLAIMRKLAQRLRETNIQRVSE